MTARKPKKLPYEWDDERGVVALGKVDTQAIQLLLGPASANFRRHCGKLLVAALNAEHLRAFAKHAKKGRK